MKPTSIASAALQRASCARHLLVRAASSAAAAAPCAASAALAARASAEASARAAGSAAAVLTTYDPALRVAVLTLSWPGRLNALTVALGEAFGAAFAALPRGACAVVLTGGGGAFSAGGDLAFLRARAAAPPLENIATMRRFYAAYLSPLRGCALPVVAAVAGAAVGAGACLAGAADVRIAAARARIGYTFTSGVAIHPGMGATHYLPRAVGPAAAAELLAGGALVSGARARELGWAQHLVEEDEAALPAAVQLAAGMARNAPLATRAALRTLRAAADAGLDAALKREAEAQALCYAGADCLEGLAAMAEKRAPVWTQYDA